MWPIVLVAFFLFFGKSMTANNHMHMHKHMNVLE